MYAILVIFIVSINLISATANSDEITNLYVKRTVNLETQLVRIKTQLKFRTLQKGEKIQRYIYLFNPNVTDYHIEVTDRLGKKVSYIENSVSLPNGILTKCAHIYYFLAAKIDEETIELNIKEVHLSRIELLYRKRPYNLNNAVRYSENMNYLSPYRTYEYKVKYQMGMLQYCSLDHLVKNGVINYLIDDVQVPYAMKYFVVEFESNDQFLRIESLARQIDVYHYDKIIVEDYVVLKNAAPELTGPYDKRIRTYYQLEPKNQKYLYKHLPASADNIQYFDTIGNISSSQILNFYDYRTLQYRTRFPLLPGWRCSFTIRYSVSMHEYLSVLSNNHLELKMRVVDHFGNDMIVEQSQTRITLPEYSRVYYVFVPMKYQRHNDSLTKGALTFKGRSTLIITGRNLIDEHTLDFSVRYRYNTWYLLKVPFILLVYIATGFVSVVFYKRFMDFCTLT